MNLDDERVLFYLNNRNRIEEWAALRREAAWAVDGWLSDAAPAIDSLAALLGADTVVLKRVDEKTPAFLLYRQQWNPLRAADPPVSIGLEWNQGKTTFYGNAVPYVGVRSHNATSIGAALRASQSVRALRLRSKDNTSEWWPAYAYMLPSAAFPSDATDYRDSLLTALRRVWDTYASLIDEVVASTPAGPT